MDKLVNELINLLRAILAAQQRLLRLALIRREAMSAFEVNRLETILEQERLEVRNMTELEKKRESLVAQFRSHLGRGVEPNITEIAKRVGEPARSQLLSLAAEIKTSVDQVSRNMRINVMASEAVIKALAKVLKIVTGFTQHAGLYMRNGRKAAPHGIHLLEVTA